MSDANPTGFRFARCHVHEDVNATTFHRLSTGKLVGVCHECLHAMTNEERLAGSPFIERSE